MYEGIAVADDRFSVGASSSGGLTVADRLKHVRNSLDTLNDISTADPNWVAVARHKLHDVYVNLWAMREACINEGVAQSTVDRAIDGDVEVEYAIDLGNAQSTERRCGESGPGSNQPSVISRESWTAKCGG